MRAARHEAPRARTAPRIANAVLVLESEGVAKLVDGDADPQQVVAAVRLRELDVGKVIDLPAVRPEAAAAPSGITGPQEADIIQGVLA